MSHVVFASMFIPGVTPKAQRVCIPMPSEETAHNLALGLTALNDFHNCIIGADVVLVVSDVPDSSEDFVREWYYRLQPNPDAARRLAHVPTRMAKATAK